MIIMPPNYNPLTIIVLFLFFLCLFSVFAIFYFLCTKKIKFLLVATSLWFFCFLATLCSGKILYNKTENMWTNRDTIVEKYMTEYNLPSRIEAQEIFNKKIDIIENTAFFCSSEELFIFVISCFSFLLSILILYFIVTKTSLKKIDIKNNLNQIIPIIASVIFLSFAIFEIDIIEESAFYSLLRIIVSATLFYISFILKNSKSVLFWLALSLGILFNPIVPIRLDDSDLWKPIDIFTIIYMFAYIVIKLKKRESKWTDTIYKK